MTRTLDDDLAGAAPPVCERTPELRAALRELVADTEKQTRRRSSGASHRGRRIAAVAIAATAVLGSATAAAAAGWVPSPWWDGPQATTQSVASSSGRGCSITYAPRAVADPAHPVSHRDRAAAMQAAAEFLRTPDAAALVRENHDTAFEVLNAGLTQALRRQGLSTHAVSVAVATDCPDRVDGAER